MNRPGKTNFAIGWTSIVIGLSMGLVLGLWAFDGPAPAPPGLELYASTARRLLRLSHIAWIALGLINVVIANSVGSAAMERTPGRALILMNFGNIGLPLTLLVAVWIPQAKYLMAVPASCILLAAIAMARIGWAARHPQARQPQQEGENDDPRTRTTTP